jgi:plasmid stabilization system protein ParE
MDFRVEIKEPAIADLAEIVSYIPQDNPDAARALGNHLLDAALSLEQAR